MRIHMKMLGLLELKQIRLSNYKGEIVGLAVLAECFSSWTSAEPCLNLDFSVINTGMVSQSILTAWPILSPKPYNRVRNMV